MTLALDYLDFDYSEDADGNGSFDALASVNATQLPQVHTEIAAVLRWAHAAFADRRGAPEDGGEWDYDLQSRREFSIGETLSFDARSGSLSVEPGTTTPPRHTLSLSIGGSADFCEAFRTQFGID